MLLLIELNEKLGEMKTTSTLFEIDFSFSLQALKKNKNNIKIFIL